MKSSQGEYASNSSIEKTASGWDEIAEYGRDNPFLKKDDIEDKNYFENRLEIARKKHIDWLRGQYNLTIEDEDFDLILKDKEDFYNSELYKEFRKNEMEEFSKQYQDVYSPSNENVANTISPFIEAVYDNADRFLEVISVFEENWQEGMDAAISFFAECFNVKHVPRLAIIEDENGADGQYSAFENTVEVNLSKTGSRIDKILDTISHEVWHAHQHTCNNERYEINFGHYWESSIDPEAYANQLVEKEAFGIAERVQRFYYEVKLPIVYAGMENNPEMAREWNKKFHEWVDDYKYDPAGSEDSDAWMKMAIARMLNSGIDLDDFTKDDPFDPIRYCTNERYKETGLGDLAEDGYPSRRSRKSLFSRLFKRKGRK